MTRSRHPKQFAPKPTAAPILTPEGAWKEDSSRHPLREVTYIDRNAVFADLFRKLALPVSR